MRQQLDAVPLDHVANVRPIDGGKGALLQTPAEQQAQVNAGTWSQLFNRDDLVNALSVPVWLIAAELLALSAVPVLWRVLPFLTDRGFGASKILGLACIAYLSWLVASLKLAPFERPLLALAWLVLLGGLVRGHVGASWRSFLAWLRRERRLLLVTEAVFLAGFGLFLFIRAANPDLWHPVFGGEKPMNFAYLNAVTKSEYFPPYDPWFAGGIINYYYFGFVLVAVLIKLTGILPEIAFNLAEPMLFGALCAGAFSLAFALSLPGCAVASRCAQARSRLRRRAARPCCWSACSATSTRACRCSISCGSWAASWRRSRAARCAWRRACWRSFQGAHFPVLDFWRSTRFIGPEDVGPIHEFPYFTFLYGDLHAHQIALPLTVARAAGRPERHAQPARRTRRSVPWPSLLIAGVLVAMLRATNTWDFPTYAAIVGLVLVLGGLHGLLRLDRRVIQTLVVSAVVFGIVFQFSFAPYLQRYQLFYNGVDPVKARTALSQFLTIHGLFFFLGGSLFAWYFVQARRRVTAARRQTKLLPEPGYYGVILPVAGLNGYASPAGWAAGAGMVLGLVFVVGGLRHARVSGLRHRRRGGGVHRPLAAIEPRAAGRPVRRGAVRHAHPRVRVAAGRHRPHEHGLQVLPAGLGAAVDHRRRRAWAGWCDARRATSCCARCARPGWPWPPSWCWRRWRTRCWPARARSACASATCRCRWTACSTWTSPSTWTTARTCNLPGDAQAIRWLQDNVVGTPVVLEGRSPVYRWGSRISIYTGLPTDPRLGRPPGPAARRLPGHDPGAHHRRRARLRLGRSAGDAGASCASTRCARSWSAGSSGRTIPRSDSPSSAAMPELRLAYDADGVQIYEVQS